MRKYGGRNHSCKLNDLNQFNYLFRIGKILIYPNIMLYNFQRKKLCSHLLVGGTLLVAALGMYSCTDKYDLDTEQPSNLNSIYGYLQDQGNFTTCLRLIDDLGKTEVLSKTGSKTMFIADDDAFAKFFSSNDWNVRSYAELTTTQKKLLLNSAMIDNPYSTSMLSTAEGPTKGEVCRRSSSLTLYDSVLALPAKSAKADSILPKNDRFKEIRANHDTIVLYTDASNAAPMVHFTYKFLATNKLESSDIDFLYNQKDSTRQNDDVYVNNAKVIKANIFCKNGFIHQVDKVIMPLDNMAEIIRKDPETKTFSGILERFAAPAYDKDATVTVTGAELTDAYNKNKGTAIDSVFNKRYFSARSAGSTREKDVAFDTDKNGATFDGELKYDPGWNGYMPLTGDPRDAMMEDMAVMLVPTDEAIKTWFYSEPDDNDKDKGAGKDVRDFYGTIENTPNSVIQELVNVNQLTSLVSSVPSRFNDVLNDANEKLGITKEDIKEVKIGCNGVVYKTNKVFAPTTYLSVLSPAVVDTTNFSIIRTAIEQMDYDKYLNSMVSQYVFLLPTNDGLLSYVDPVSYGTTTSQLWEFHYDPSKKADLRIYADVYKCVLDANGRWQKDGDRVTQVKNQSISTLSTVLHDRLENLLDNIIVTTAWNSGQHYYRTKGNQFVRIDGITEGSHVWGSGQIDRDAPLTVSKCYTKRNGYALVLDGPIMGTSKSVAMSLQQASESQTDENYQFTDFLEMMKKCGILNIQNGKDGWSASDYTNGNIFNIKTYGDIGAEDKPSGSATKKAAYILNNYHYTIYAPTNAAMQKAYEAGLPTIAELEAAEAEDSEAGIESTDTASQSGKIMEVMLDFIKYHIQDNSVFVDGSSSTNSYESAKTELIESTQSDDAGNITHTGKYSPGRPYKITVTASSDGMTVTDNIGNTHNVVKKDGLYNIMAEEYWFGSSSDGTGSKVMSTTANPYSYFLINSSSVAIQAIDGPLIYADGKHKDVNGNIVPTQFKYLYKPLTIEAKRR